MAILKKSFLGLVAFLLATDGVASGETLGIPSVAQQTPVWCWVAVGEMVFDHYGIPNVNPAGNYQCGIIGLLAAGTWAHACAFRCELCSVPAGSAQGVLSMLTDYPRRAAEATGEEVPRLAATHRRRAISPDDLMSEIDDGNPIIAGISPTGRPPGSSTSAHVALIVGYRETEESLEILVNDPFPFGAWGGNPYLTAGAIRADGGSYWIDYGSFKSRLLWAESFLVREAGTIRPAVGRSCCLPSGDSCGPFENVPPQPLGASCSCQFGNPYASGRVCR